MARRLVIPDIHGCSQTFKALLQKISLTKDDLLFLLGDYIDRGPDSSGVIDYIMKLQSDGYNIKPLLGNHEQEIIEASKEYDTPTFKFYVRRFKSLDLLNSEGKIKKSYFDFMNNLPYYIVLPDYYLVHGAINFEKDNPFEERRQLLVLRSQIYNSEKAGNRRIVYGHQPTYLENIRLAIENKTPLIPLDNGCAYTKPHKIYDYTHLGNLVCFNLDSFELTLQKNIDL
jgi:serine/threonine protein phosphatase 1